MNIANLQHEDWILFQISHIVETWERLELEHQPAHVGVKQTLGNTIRILIVIHMLVVAAMFARPKEHRILRCSRPNNNGEKPHNPVSLESQMREKSMVSKRDGGSTHAQQYSETWDVQ